MPTAPPPVCTRGTQAFTLNAEAGRKQYFQSLTRPYVVNIVGCSWEITAPIGQCVKLNITEFNTERNYDYVYVYDTANEDDESQENQLAKLSGWGTDHVYLSSGRSLNVMLTSDGSNNAEGFQASYIAVEPPAPTATPTATPHGYGYGGGEYDEPPAPTATPTYYCPATCYGHTCDYWVQQGFTCSNLESNSNNCDCTQCARCNNYNRRSVIEKQVDTPAPTATGPAPDTGQAPPSV